MPEPINPIDIPLADNFPRGADASFLWNTRELIREHLDEKGYACNGAGMGCGRGKGEADLGFEKNGQRVEVRIFLPE